MPSWACWGGDSRKLPGPWGGEGADCARRGRKVAKKWLPPALPEPGGGFGRIAFGLMFRTGPGGGGDPPRPFQAGNLAKMVRQGRPQQAPN